MEEYFNPHEQITHSKRNRRFTRLVFYIQYLWNKYCLRRKIFAIEPCISASWGRVEHNNWGDELNVFFLARCSKDCLLPRSIMVYPLNSTYYSWLNNCVRVSLIGSILDMYTDVNTIVWGSGLLSEDFCPTRPLHNIKAVRGPLTRQMLIKNGVDCPEVYGDPALLLPYYYPSKRHKKFRLGIVPHYVDSNKDEVRKFRDEDGVCVIDMFNYRKWTDVIDAICSCEFVVSSSLHGLIVAEAYNIPNAWIEVNQPIVGDVKRRFKFHDFFLSIGLDRDYPFVILKDTTIDTILSLKDNYHKAPGISLKPLVEACPFQLCRPLKPII